MSMELIEAEERTRELPVLPHQNWYAGPHVRAPRGPGDGCTVEVPVQRQPAAGEGHTGYEAFPAG